MTTPGVGPVVALTYRATVDVPAPAQSMLRSKKWSWLKAWAMQITRRRGMKKAIVALARRLAVIMHLIWVDDTEFRWTREAAAA
jgi:transposase